uniref:Small ribosomal subunit protein uS10m n=1 Tax=Moina brachiata TaxID=675436 RepID=A0A4Y7NJD0_9CRUS|nr:EOG090X0GP9 [Moina brachiata]SVE93338.1 EOG090X0GP9 [Moina brachiata]
MLLRQCVLRNALTLHRPVKFIASVEPQYFQSYNRLHDAAAVEAPTTDSLLSKVEIGISGADPAVLQSYSRFVKEAARCFHVSLTECVAPPKAHHNRLTLLKSIHVYKKHRVQYEVRTYGIQLTLEKLTGSTSSTFLEYIQRNLPEGVAMKTSMTKLPENIVAYLNVRLRNFSEGGSY